MIASLQNLFIESVIRVFWNLVKITGFSGMDIQFHSNPPSQLRFVGDPTFNFNQIDVYYSKDTNIAVSSRCEKILISLAYLNSFISISICADLHDSTTHNHATKHIVLSTVIHRDCFRVTEHIVLGTGIYRDCFRVTKQQIIFSTRGRSLKFK